MALLIHYNPGNQNFLQKAQEGKIRPKVSSEIRDMCSMCVELST
jgi:hypothetical protein